MLVDGTHHVTFLTDDMDRLVAFYERVFEAKKTLWLLRALQSGFPATLGRHLLLGTLGP